MVIAKVKAGNTFDNLLNEIRQIAYLYCLYWAKKKLKKLYNDTIKSLQI